ncbi:MAG: SEL1-like repeat protein [Acidobacteria bacterium]|nr:SEL1-like repeat protein [Acidobacteriota bacterium]
MDRACRDGEAAACHHLGTIYDDGVGVPSDRVRAASYYRKACAGGEPSKAPAHMASSRSLHGAGVSRAVTALAHA